MTPVRNNPQPLAALRQRYRAALEFVYDQRRIVEMNDIRPGEVSAQVFDHEDGLRLIVSRERDDQGAVHLHFSASFSRECQLAAAILDMKSIIPPHRFDVVFAEMVVARFRILSGDARPIIYLGMSDRMVPHWIIEGDDS